VIALLNNAAPKAEVGRVARALVGRVLGGVASVGNWVQKYRRGALGALGAVALVLGYVGFSTHATIGEKPPLDRLYLALQLFVLNWSPEGNVPLALDVARFLAPVVSVLGAVAILRLLLTGQLGVLRAWFLRDHVVICGAGRKGSALAVALVRQRRSVVVIDDVRAGSELSTLSDRDVVKIRGDATSIRSLKRARVGTAREVVAFAGEDGTNIDVARAVAALPHRTGARIYVHIANEHVAGVLRQSDVFRARRVEVVNHLEVASRWLVGRHGTGRKVVLLGSDALARQLTLEVARFWRTVRSDERDALPVNLVAPDATAAVGTLMSQVPSLHEIIELEALECADERLAASLVEGELRGAGDRVVVAVVFGDEGRAADAALQIRGNIASSSVVVITRVDRLDTGLGRLLATSSEPEAVELFAPTEAGVDPEHLFEWREELLARVLHTDYLRRLKTDAPSTTAPSSDLPQWDELDDEERAQDRDRARLLLQRLEEFGYAIEGSLEWELKEVSLSTDELETLARDEHHRWLALKRQQGWSLGPEKDAGRKVHPDLDDWPQLSKASREYNLDVARALPAALSSLGVLVEPRSGESDPTA
jgi:voltage-gated potassium channel Kch